MNDRLRIDSLAPSPVPVGWEGTLTIHGHSLGKPGFVNIEGREPRYAEWTATEIKVEVSKAFTDTPGEKRLYVHDLGGDEDETKWVVEKR